MTPTPGLQHARPIPYLTISELDKFVRCPRLYFYQTACGLRSEEHVAMFYGTCIHKAIGVILSTKDYNAGVEAFKIAWGDTIGDDSRNPEMARVLLFFFYQTWFPHFGSGLYEALAPPASQVTIVSSDRISDWEIPWALDIGLPIPLVGRMDGWCRSRQTGEIWALEFKTSREMTSRFTDGFKAANPQCVGYAMALQAHLPDVKVAGTVVVGLQTAKTTQKIEFSNVHVMPWDYDDFLSWAQEQGSRILSYQAYGWWPKWRSGCTTYPSFGQPGYMCDFHSACGVPDWSALRGYYRQEYHVPYQLEGLPDDPPKSPSQKGRVTLPQLGANAPILDGDTIVCDLSEGVPIR